VQPGDVIGLTEKGRKIPALLEAVESVGNIPSYLQVDKKALQATYLPEMQEVPIICEVTQVVEFYSR
jgi:small subunit ribosomal protein S4